jgi:hypothetical protein
LHAYYTAKLTRTSMLIFSTLEHRKPETDDG